MSPSAPYGRLRQLMAGLGSATCEVPAEKPLPDRRSQIGYAVFRVKPLGVDSRDQGVDRELLALRGLFQSLPEHRLEADRGLVTGDGDGALGGLAEHHQYICCPPLMDRVEPVTKPAFSSTKKATPRAISSALPRRLTGILATILASTSSGTAATISVSI